MGINFEELDYRQTHLGVLSLRRRREPLLGIDVFEIKLNDDFLMSSLFTEAETELARSCLSGLANSGLDVLIGGLGLGYTVRSALEQRQVRSVTVIEALAGVIDWHRQGLIPLGKQICEDARCNLVHGDFFSIMNSGIQESAAGLQEQLYHSILLDIDHSPRFLLHPDHAEFYLPEGLMCLAEHLHPGGVFGMWSNESPDNGFLEILAGIFDTATAKIVRFHNPYQDRLETATIYIARMRTIA